MARSTVPDFAENVSLAATRKGRVPDRVLAEVRAKIRVLIGA